MWEEREWGGRGVGRKEMWEYGRTEMRDKRVCWDMGRMGRTRKEGYRGNMGMWEEREVGTNGIWKFGKKGNGKKGNGEEGNVVIWEKGNVR